jgi:hypothetical protein
MLNGNLFTATAGEWMEELGIDKCLGARRTGRGGGVILLIKKYKGMVKVCVLVR